MGFYFNRNASHLLIVAFLGYEKLSRKAESGFDISAKKCVILTKYAHPGKNENLLTFKDKNTI